jgi:hypothetical protein
LRSDSLVIRRFSSREREREKERIVVGPNVYVQSRKARWRFSRQSTMELNVCEENTLMKKIVIVGDWNMRRHPLSKRLRKYIDHEELKLIRERHPA